MFSIVIDIVIILLCRGERCVGECVYMCVRVCCVKSVIHLTRIA
nr:MAG TPA: hypothetical protein [Caudoviricetes sp.]